MQLDERHPVPVHPELPVLRTSFVGRESAIAAVMAMLAEHRLVSLTGSGGSGKTRLALRVAEASLALYPDGIWWVDLAPLSDAALLPGVVAAALGLREQPDRSLEEVLHEQLDDRSTLLILDNCEHVAAACADFLNRLGRQGRSTVLLTSREPVRAGGEKVWQLPLLELPPLPAAASERQHQGAGISLERLGAVESVRLFVERARTVAPGFALNERNAEAIALICRRLEGLPLAIELAAARCTVLTPHEIAARLDNSLALLTRATHGSDARHSMLRAAIDGSIELLAPAELALFVRLAAFTGGFDLQAVEGICAGAGLEHGALLDLLAALVEKSLVLAAEHGEQMRYRLLEPIRHYAAELMLASGEQQQWHARHAAYFLAFAQAADAGLDRNAQPVSLELLDREHDNIVAALAWCASSGAVDTSLRLCITLQRYWRLRGHFSLGQRWLGELLERVDATVEPPIHAGAVLARARLYDAHSEYPAARRSYEQGLALAQYAEDEADIAAALIGLGGTLTNLGDLGAARSMLEAAVALSRDTSNSNALASALGNLGDLNQWTGDAADARSCFEQARFAAREAGNLTVEATTLMNLAILAAHAGDYAAARVRYGEAVEAHRQLGDEARSADTLLNLGLLEIDAGEQQAAEAYLAQAESIYRARNSTGDLGFIAAGRGDLAFLAADYQRAQAHYQQALGLFRAAGHQRLIGRALGSLGYVAVREGRLKDAAGLCAEALSLRRAIGHQAGLLFALDRGYIELALALGRPAIAARLVGAVEAAREALHRPRTPLETRTVEPIKVLLRSQLGEANYGSVANEGRSMSLLEAASYAQDSLAPATVEQPAPELRIFALGALRVYRGDRLLTSADWTYAKARELVLFLLFQPQATREQIGVELWPEASSEQVRQRFSAALAHARNALGRDKEWITLHNGRYSFNRTQPVWIDVDAFEAGLFEAQLLRRNGKQDERAASLLAEAVALYSGDFASDVQDGEWHVARREALRHAWLEALRELGVLHARAGRYEQAIAVLQRAVDADAYFEEAYHDLIDAYARVGKRRQALAQYEKLLAALAELHAVPSAATMALIERLQHGRAL